MRFPLERLRAVAFAAALAFGIAVIVSDCIRAVSAAEVEVQPRALSITPLYGLGVLCGYTSFSIYFSDPDAAKALWLYLQGKLSADDLRATVLRIYPPGHPLHADIEEIITEVCLDVGQGA